MLTVHTTIKGTNLPICVHIRTCCILQSVVLSPAQLVAELHVAVLTCLNSITIRPLKIITTKSVRPSPHPQRLLCLNCAHACTSTSITHTALLRDASNCHSESGCAFRRVCVGSKGAVLVGQSVRQRPDGRSVDAATCACAFKLIISHKSEILFNDEKCCWKKSYSWLCTSV